MLQLIVPFFYLITSNVLFSYIVKENHSTSKVFYFLIPIYLHIDSFGAPISQENAGFFHKFNKIRNTIVLYGVE